MHVYFFNCFQERSSRHCRLRELGLKHTRQLRRSFDILDVQIVCRRETCITCPSTTMPAALTLQQLKPVSRVIQATKLRFRSLTLILKHIYNICSNAAAAGTIHEISYGSIQRTLTEILDCDSQDLKPLKGDIKAYALQLLVCIELFSAGCFLIKLIVLIFEQDSGPAIQDPSPSHSGSSPLPKKTQVHETPSPSPVKSAKRKRAVISSSDGEDASDKDVTNEKPKEVTPSKRRPISRPDTQKEPAGGYKVS